MADKPAPAIEPEGSLGGPGFSLHAATMSERPLVLRPLVIAHRGASAHLPEHTLAAYARAIADGADLIEPDLVMTRDGVLVARHENEIGATTDVAAHRRFAARRTRKRIDGVTVDGWFTEDFTLAELKRLRTRERLPDLRGTAHDGRFPVATLEEIIELLAAESARHGRTIGLIPEIKHGSWFLGQGLPMEQRLLDTLRAHACTRRAPVVIQSFELANLRALRTSLGDMPNVRLLQLIDRPQAQPWDVTAAGGHLRYADLVTPAGLRQVAAWADAIGPSARAILPVDDDGRLGPPTSLVREAHDAGLEVYAWTFRPENLFLPRALWCGGDPAARHPDGSIAEIRAHLEAGIDGFFVDDPALGACAMQQSSL